MYPVYISGSLSLIWMVAKGKQPGLVELKQRAFQVRRPRPSAHSKPENGLDVAVSSYRKGLFYLLAFYV